MYNATAIKVKKEVTLRAEIYKEKPAEQQEFEGDCESKIISMQGLDRNQFELAIKAAFPDWQMFCCWEAEADEF